MIRRGAACCAQGRASPAPTILFLFCFFLISNAYAATFSRTQILMGNVPVTISVKAPSSRKLEAFLGMEKAYAEAERIEKKVSEFQPTSDTSCLNLHSGRKWCEVGNDLFILLTASQYLSEITEGVFDITFASPNKGASYRDILVNQRKKRAFLQKPNMKIGVSSVAKGYILDQMAVILRGQGFHHFIVNGGGDLVADGKWKIKIRGSHQSFRLQDQAAMSSGLLERGHHIIDPRTHHSVSPDYLSVTVISPSGIIGGGLGTAAFILGPAQTEKVLKSFPGTKAIFMNQENR